MLTSPRSRFLGNKGHVKTHLDIIDSTPFVTASDAAMLQMISELPNTEDPNVAIANYHRIVGARDYLKQLQTIAVVPPKAQRRQSDNLHGNQ